MIRSRGVVAKTTGSAGVSRPTFGSFGVKRGIDDLAVFGGPAAFDEPLYVGRPNIGNRERFLSRLNDILDSHWLTNNGKYVQELEARLGEILGVKHCIVTSNGTVALELGIRSLGMTGEVLVPSFTFVATAHALRWQEIAPVFVDIDPRTFNLDPDCLSSRVTPRTTGILGVHLWGRPCDTDRLTDFAGERGLRLLFDASHAFGCTHGGRRVGTFGDAEIFSFHATKFINAFEGGAIATNSDELAAKIRLMKNFGFSGFDNVVYLGTNGKMSEAHAAMGLTNLESMDDFLEHNRRNYACYRHELADIANLELIPYNDEETCNYQYIVTLLDPSSGIDRDRLIEILHAENVVARRYFYPGCHRMEPYRSDLPNVESLLPHTRAVADAVMTLPTGLSVGHAAVRTIGQILRFVMDHGEEISRRQA